MKIISKQTIELIGITALVVSLVFVAWELRQSNRIAIATAESDLRSANRDAFALAAENLELAAIIAKAREPEATLDSAEEVAFQNYSSVIFNIITQANAAYENGLLTSYSLDIYKGTISTNLESNPLFVYYWARTVRYFDLHQSESELWNHLAEELTSRGVEL